MQKKNFGIFFLVILTVMFLLSLLSFAEWVLYPVREPVYDTGALEGKYPVSESYEEYCRGVADRLGTEIKPESREKPAAMWEPAAGLAIKEAEQAMERFTNTEGIVFSAFFKKSKMAFEQMLGMDLTASLYSGGGELPWKINQLMKMENGQLGYALREKDISQDVLFLADFAQRMQKEGRNFLYVDAPGKYASAGVFTDHSPEIEKQKNEILARYRIDRLDLGSVLRERGMQDQDIFFASDHHWKPSTGIQATGILAEYLNREYGYQIDLQKFELENFHRRVLEDQFLGIAGEKVSEAYIAPEDFEILTPKYDSSLEVRINCGTPKTGTIEETLCDAGVFEDLPYPRHTARTYYYYYYGLGDLDLIQSHNNLIKDGRKVMLIKTSFAACMYPFLAGAVEDLTIVDLRAFSGSLEQLVEETDPDTIIYLNGLFTYLNSSGEGGIFDFR